MRSRALEPRAGLRRLARRPEEGASRAPLRATDAEALRRVSHFASLPAAEVERLAAQCAARVLQPGDVLFEEGRPCRGLFVVAAGSVEVRQTSLHGREQVFHTEGAGATLAEGPLFDRGGYIATAVVTRPARILFLRRADVLDLCARHPAVALSMLEGMARRLRRFADIVTDLAVRPIPERLARYLHARVAAGDGGAEIDLALTQAQLAARLGTVRELVARAFGQLEDRGIIARRRARVEIRDPARLAALARGEPPAAAGRPRSARPVTTPGRRSSV